MSIRPVDPVSFVLFVELFYLSIDFTSICIHFIILFYNTHNNV